MTDKTKLFNKRIEELCKEHEVPKDLISDGYHTFKELYWHRMILFSVICNQNKDIAWKSKLHADGTMYDYYFIVGITTPEGDYTYHYNMEYWDHFQVKELKNAPEWDGHEPKDITRLRSISKQPDWIPCSERLPEDLKSVLVSFNKFVTVAYIDYENGDYKNGNRLWCRFTGAKEPLEAAKAWMPLPEPYKGE